MTMKSILILEPSGAVNINPNLTAIVRCLCAHDFYVDIMTSRRQYAQTVVCANSSLLLCISGAYAENLTVYQQLQDRYDLVIGVDQAIVAASFIAEKMSAPLAFISYEILFADEVGTDFKIAEMEACRKVSFAISQDPVRGYLVSREYGIPLERVLCIPVADSGLGEVERTHFLRTHFRIPEDRKIAVFAGAVSGKSMIDELLEAQADWPDEWVLVVHSYAGIPAADVRRFGRRHDLSRVYFSDMKLDSIDELLRAIASADLGICFFKPTLQTRYEGKNMLFIGLSSGKFPLYLKAGLPVIINEVGAMSDLVRQHALGRVAGNVAEITPAFLATIDVEAMRRRCREVYARQFDFDVHAAGLLAAVDACLGGVGTPATGIDPADIERQIGEINRLSEWFNAAASARNSRYYRAGESMFHLGVLASSLYATAKPLLKRALRRDGGDFISRFNADLIRFYGS